MSDSWNNIHTVCCKPWLVLPTVYSDALSYAEQLDKFCYSLNKLIENNNILPEYIAEQIKEYISSGAIGEVVREILANYILNVKYPPKGITPAVGDGSADDTEALQGCIDYASENGGVVYFPYGSYLTQPLTMKSGVSLFGFDRYSTKVVLKGGATKALLNGNASGLSVCGLTLDGNSGIQVNNVNVIDMTGSDLMFNKLIIKDGYKLFNFIGDGHLQLNDIVFGNAVENCFSVDGNVIVQAKNLLFTALSKVGGVSVIDIKANGGDYDFNSVAKCDICMMISGNDNKVVALIGGASEDYVDTGEHNNVKIVGHSQKEYYSGNVKKDANNSETTLQGTRSLHVVGESTVAIDSNSTESVDGSKSEIVTGVSSAEYKADRIVKGTNKSETFTGKKVTNAQDIVLNPNSPLTYKTPSDKYKYFKSIPFKDNDSEYDVLVYKNNELDTDIDNLKKQSFGKDFELHRIGRQAFVNGQTQGSCWVKDRLAQFIIFDDKATLYLLNPYNGIIYTTQEFEVYHANTCTYVENENKIYVSTLSAAHGNYVNYVEAIDATTLDINRVDMSKYITYDSIAYVSYDNTTHIMYLGDFNKHITAINWDTKKIIYNKELSLPNYYKLSDAQSFNVNDGIIYFYTFTNIFALNANTLDLVKIFKLPLWTDLIYYVGEVESLAFNGDEIIVSSCCKYRNESDLYFTEYFIYNPNIGVGETFRRNITIYHMDNYYNVNTEDGITWNPDGTTSAFGGCFNYYDELMLSLSSPFNRVNNVTIKKADMNNDQARTLALFNIHDVIFYFNPQSDKLSVPVSVYGSSKIGIKNANLTSLYVSDSEVRIYPDNIISGIFNGWRSTIYDLNGILNSATEQHTGNTTIFTKANTGFYPDSNDESNMVVSYSGRLQAFSNNAIVGFKHTSVYYILAVTINNAKHAFIPIRDFILNGDNIDTTLAFNGKYYIVNLAFTISNGTLTCTPTVTPDSEGNTIAVKANNILGVRLV